MPFFAQRRSENVLRAFKAGRIHVFERQIKILGTGLGIDGQAAIAGLANFFQRVVAAQMHDVDRRAGHFGERDGARRGFGFGRGRARERVILRSGLSFGQRLLDDHVDGAAVFRVHADHGAVLRGRAQGLEDAGVVEHENAGIGHEQFEAGDAFADQFVHLGQLCAGKVGDDAVKCVVADGLARSLAHPGVEGVRRDWPLYWIAKSISVVVPPKAAARVPVSKSSALVVPPKGMSRWV